MHPVLKALICQIVGVGAIILIANLGLMPPLSPLALACLQGLFAALFALLLHSPRWWQVIHFGFTPCIVLAARLGIPAWVYFTCFLGISLIYWSSFRTQVPLFLTNRYSTHRLALALPDSINKVLDLGSGIGSFAHRMAQLRPDWVVKGIENAPIPYAIAHIKGRSLPNLSYQRGNFWNISLHSYDVVYAFLSPVPMSRLWQKALKEMRPGALLVSNSFTIDEAIAEKIIHTGDALNRKLYFYRIPQRIN